jgi:hypothetical protein
LREVGSEILEYPNNYWKRKRFWGTAGIYFLPNIISLLGKRRLFDML